MRWERHILKLEPITYVHISEGSYPPETKIIQEKNSYGTWVTSLYDEKDLVEKMCKLHPREIFDFLKKLIEYNSKGTTREMKLEFYKKLKELVDERKLVPLSSITESVQGYYSFIKDGVGRWIIPGSSLKGAFVSVYEKFGRDGQNKKIENNIMFRDVYLNAKYNCGHVVGKRGGKKGCFEVWKKGEVNVEVFTRDSVRIDEVVNTADKFYKEVIHEYKNTRIR